MNNRILRILFIVFGLSAYNLMAEDINVVFNSVQELPIKHNQESEIIWDFRNVKKFHNNKNSERSIYNSIFKIFNF